MRGLAGLAIIAGGLCWAAAAGALEEATAAYNAGRYSEAVKLYRRAANQGESPALCYYNAANACFQLDSLAQSVVYYRACIRNAPKFFKAHLNLAICYYSLNDLGRCLASLERALRIEPLNQKALLIQASTFRRCGATAKAVATFEKLARLFPDLEEPPIALGEMYRELGDLEMALSWLSAVPIGGKNAEYVALVQADIFEKRGDFSRAIFYLNQAFDSDPLKRWTLYRIANLHRTNQNDLVALETCREGLKRFPDFGDLAVLGGTIAFERGRIEEAERFFTQGQSAGSPAAVVGLSNIRAWRKAQEPE